MNGKVGIGIGGLFASDWVAFLTGICILDRVMQKNHRFTLMGESLRQKPKSSKKEVNPEPS